MNKDFYSFLYLFDLIGINPQLLIFNNKRFKSKLSALLSILIILFSIYFVIFSFIEYLKNQIPNIAYTRDNDETTKRNFLLKDLILLFQLIDNIDTFDYNTINNSIAYYMPTYVTVYNNGTVLNTSLNYERCEFGKNIDTKYKDLANEKYTYGRKLEEFYCIGHEHGNLPLFFEPNIGFSAIILYVIFKNNTIYTPEDLHSLIISENNIIDHSNKKNPISKSYSYHFTQAYNSFEYTKINYNFQYIKYESDEGLLYQKSRLLQGVSFSDITFFRNNQGVYYFDESTRIIGAIEFGINKSNFDSYKRTYKKLQTLLAEIMSVINLLFEAGRQISKFLCERKMSCDIIDNLFNNNNNNKKVALIHQKYNNKKIIHLKEENKEEESEKKI